MSPLLLTLLAQFPPTSPGLDAEPLRAAPSARVPIAVVGRPGLSWDGSKWVVAWRDGRRFREGNAGLYTFASAWDGGAQLEYPQGLPVPQGATLAAPDDLHVVSNRLFSLVVFPRRLPDGGMTLVGAPTVANRGVNGEWDGPIALSQSEAVTEGSSAAVADDDSATVGWAGTAGIHLVTLPGLGRSFVDAGAGVSRLSLTPVDGGVLVVWVDSSAQARAAVVNSVTAVSRHVPVETLGDGGVLRVKVLSGPRGPLATLQTVTGSWMLASDANQAWSLSALPLTDPAFAPLTVSNGAALVSVYRGSSSNFVRAAQLLAPGGVANPVPWSGPPREPVALALERASVMALVRDGLRVVGQPFTVTTTNGVTPTVLPPIEPLMTSPVRQAFPSAVWVDEARAFLVAWDEEQVDGGWGVKMGYLEPSGELRSEPVPLPGAPANAIGLRPRLLKRPSGGGYGIHLRTTPLGWSVSQLLLDGGVPSVGARLTGEGGRDRAALGDVVATQWSGVGNLTSVWVGTDVSPLITLAGPAPSCVPGLDGKLFFFTHDGLLLKGAKLNEAARTWTPVTTGAVSPLASPGPVCATTVGSSLSDGGVAQELALVFRAGSTVNLVLLTSGGDTVTAERQLSGSASGEPLIVDTTYGPVVAWEGRGEDGVQARLTSSPDPVSLGGLDVQNLAVAPSPLGVAAFVWDAFVTDGGSRQVMMRVVGEVRRPDAGVSRDAGVDGGGVATDAGPADTDGGATTDVDGGGGQDDDGGARAVDGGASDGGRNVLVFQPTSCGCTGAPAPWLLPVALLALRRRRAVTSRAARG